ncbi:hypothetical protein NQ176_g6130 [Zarea fungicola]|uniref:Uncharacterized protein n=1 Tax=Zarea fungicola TaxID=93591 RepID=A0ACC1N796_9HYPO|nr:hypothetical protein NQ176_g6130 [Lecanicillium fungicola]
MSTNQASNFDWAAVQREIFSAAATETGTESSFSRHVAGAHAGSHDQRMRSLSLSLPWRRPKSSLFVHDDEHANENAIDDSNDHYAGPEHRRFAATGTIKGMIRRASHSIRGMVHRRPSLLNEEPIHEQKSDESRPATANSAWNKLRQATSFRHTRSTYGMDPSFPPYTPNFSGQNQIPIPAVGNEPPYIPEHGGAAAKASAAMQNEFFARNRWLYKPSSDDGNDRESGIGIVLTGASADFDIDAEIASKTANISRVDFIAQLPTELAIQILAKLDASGLGRLSTVSKTWAEVIHNQHVWRESFWREMGRTYATSTPVQPNTGLGIPKMVPSNDWKRAYQIKRQLNQHWREGKATPVYLSGHTDSVYCLQFDETKIISGSRDKTIRIWDMRTLECRLIIGPPEVVQSDDILTDEKGNLLHYAAGADDDRMVQSTPEIASFNVHHKASILCLQYDEEILVTGSSDGTAIIYDIKDQYRPIRRLEHHTAAVLDLVFDDKHIVTCSKDTTICVWDRASGAMLRQLRGHGGPLWNIETGKTIREFAGHTKGLACSQFSEDGRYVASAGNDKVIRIWDAHTGECRHEMRAHENLVRSLHIDSVSGRLISGSYDTDIKVWDMETGLQLLDFPRWHASWVLSAKSDYRRIVSTGQAPKILIMDFGADIEGINVLDSNNPPLSSRDSGFF